MQGYIDNVDFINIEAEKYWSFPSTYKGNKNKEIKEMILSNNYIGSEKKDGMYARFIKDEEGKCFLISRNTNIKGEMTNKIGHVPQLKSFFDTIPNGTCVLGELYFPNNPGSRKVTTIMGCLEEKAIDRQNTGEKLHYYIFDVWANNGKSLLKTTIEERVSILDSMSFAFINDYIEYANYYIGKKLEEEFFKIKSKDGEGIVITKIGTIPSPGKRTARKTLKIKTELDNPIDCFLTGRWKSPTKIYNGKLIEEWPYWENIKTGEKINGKKYTDYVNGAPIEPISKLYYNGWASAIELGLINDSGEEVPVAWISGISEEVKKGIVENNSFWKHKVVMVNAMDIEKDTYHFRHGRIVDWREDKKWEDCDLSQLWSNE